MQTLIVTFQCDIKCKVFANNILNPILFYAKFSQSFFLTSIASCKKYAPSMLYPDKKNLPGIFPEKIYSPKKSTLRWRCGKIWHLLLWIAWAWDNVFKCMENAATVLSFKKVKIWQSTTIEIIASKCNLSYSYVFILGFIFFSE